MSPSCSAIRGGNISVLSQNPGAAKIMSITKAHLSGYLQPRNLGPSGANPVGNIDEVSVPGTGRVRVRGWAFDSDNSGASIDVHVYVGGPAGSAGAQGYPLRAQGSRPDVNNVHRIGGNHGFDAVLNTGKVRFDAGLPVRDQYRWRRQACTLGCRTVTISDPQPGGVVDEVTALGGGKVRVRGWTYDPDDSSASLTVHVYIGPQPGQPGSWALVFPANVSRRM